MLCSSLSQMAKRAGLCTSEPLYPVPHKSLSQPPPYAHQSLFLLQAHRDPQDALARRELQASLGRWDLQALQVHLGPQGRQPLSGHPMPRFPCMVSPPRVPVVCGGANEAICQVSGVCPHCPVVTQLFSRYCYCLFTEEGPQAGEEGHEHRPHTGERGSGFRPTCSELPGIRSGPPQASELAAVQPSECWEAQGLTSRLSSELPRPQPWPCCLAWFQCLPPAKHQVKPRHLLQEAHMLLAFQPHPF